MASAAGTSGTTSATQGDIGGRAVAERGYGKEEGISVSSKAGAVGRRSRLKVTSGLLAALCLVVVAMSVLPGTATAATGINKLTASSNTTQAGGHPNARFSIEYKFRLDEPADPCYCDDPRQISFHFPTGFIGDPHAAPTCDLAAFSVANCPVESQIGMVEAGESTEGGFNFHMPLYNLVTHPDQAGQVGFIFPLVGFPVLIDLSGRTESDYGLDSVSAPIVHVLMFPYLGFELWGVPAYPENDFYRFITPLQSFGECGALAACGDGTVSGIGSNATPEAYLQNPTTCGEELAFSAEIEYYNGETFHAETPWPKTTGCNQLTFNPSLSATPTTNQSDTASGVDVDLKVPQGLSPSTPSASEIRTNRVILPEGFSINPGAADGKLVCGDDQTGIGTRGPATCPESSKIGTVTIDVAALPAPLDGAMYLGEPLPGERYRLVLAADGSGTHVKLHGTVTPDPRTGKLEVSFEDLPQQPLQELNMHIFGSERGLLATPTKCGKYPVETEFVPWDSALTNQISTSYFTIDSGPLGAPCPGNNRPFSPSLQAGDENPTAGNHSIFSLRVARDDGDQNVTGINVTTPPGFTATLAGIPYCPESAISLLTSAGYSGLTEQSAPACPTASRIGTAVAGAGAGTHPLFTPGKVYLAGPYRGAPLSLVVVVPAIAGPYDLGNVAVRVAVQIDPVTAQVTASSDPIPLILEGVPLRLRSIEVALDRPNFTLNPTNCEPFAVTAQIFGNEGSSATPKAHFQVGNCSELDFGPKLGLKLHGSTKRRGNPSLRAVLRSGSGEANLRRAVVTMPHVELLDNSHISTVCTTTAFATDTCPPGSLLGSATAFTPLLSEPLTGSVYLRSSNHRLPDLVADLRGQVRFELVGRIDGVKGGRLRTTFATIPDVPVTKFVLDLLGGKNGLLLNSTNLCTAHPRAHVRLAGQNGRQLKRNPMLQTSCGAASSKVRRHRISRRHARRRAVR
jgi:hypothetical protein